MSKMLKFFRDLNKKSNNFPIEKVNEKWKFRFGVLKKNIENFSYEKVNEKWKFRKKTTKDFPIKKCEFAC